MSDLGDDARALLAQARVSGEDDPTPEDRARLRGKLAAALVISAGGAAATHAALPKAAAAQATSMGLGTKIIVASLVVATAGAALVSLRGRGEDARERPTAATRVARPSQVAPAAAIAPAAVALHEPPKVVPSGQAAAQAAAPRGTKPAPQASGSSDRARRASVDLDEVTRLPSLRAELALIEAAQEALRAGRPEAALERAAEHAARFPRGALVQERLGIDAVALCAVGERARGLRALKQLAQRAPNAPLLARARAACREPDAE